MKHIKKYFGTDGMRGRYGDAPITPEFTAQLAWAIGQVFKAKHNKVLITRDTRESGPALEQALLAGFAAAGMQVECLGVLPTPACAHLTVKHQADVGVVISASHNPWYDNGIKLFSENGIKLSDAIECEIEALCDKAPAIDLTQAIKGVDHHDAARLAYTDFCKTVVNADLRDFKVVLDCANGATQEVAPVIFAELGCEVIAINTQSDGRAINADCGSTSPDMLINAVRTHQADVGIAFDGDGDRVILVDAKGELVDGDEILYIIAQHAKANQSLHGGVIGTLMSNMGLEHALNTLGIEFRRTKVGDRYVIELLRELGWQLGGETSGHIICMDNITTGDGIIGALRVLAVMAHTQKTLHELKQGMDKYPNTLINVPVTNAQQVLSLPAVKQACEEVTQSLKDNGRLIIRASGTEPVLRISVEAKDANVSQTLCQQLADVICKSIT